MGLAKALGSRRLRKTTALSMLVQAVLAFRKGRPRSAAMLLGAATLAYRWSTLGIVAAVLIRLNRSRR